MAVTLRFDDVRMRTIKEAFADERYWRANTDASKLELEMLTTHAAFIRPFHGFKSWPHTFFADRALTLITSLGRYRDLLIAEGDLVTAERVSELGRALQDDFKAEGGKEQLEKIARRARPAEKELLELAA